MEGWCETIDWACGGRVRAVVRDDKGPAIAGEMWGRQPFFQLLFSPVDTFMQIALTASSA